MRKALSENNVNRANIAQSHSVPAPTMGWNVRDSIANMEPTDAIIIDNYFPSTGSVDLRRGFTEHATGMTGSIETLAEWAGPQSRKLKACVNNKIYDVSSTGAVGAAEVSGLANNRWQYVNFGNTGGHYLLMVNGADDYRAYDGTTWTTPTINNVSGTALINIQTHQRRVWFVESNSLSAWYLDTDAISGDAVELDIGPLCSMGGYLQSIATWTVDGGAGSDDLIAFITTQGQVVVYAGTDPAADETWALQGVYQIGRPIGRRCFQKFGGDMIFITEDGFVPLSKSLITGRSLGNIAISDKISGAVNSAVRQYSGNFGWQVTLYPRGTQLIFNIPIQENGTAHQFVMNTITGAWCRFLNMDGSCWGLFNDEIYFGGNGVVYKADDGENDNDDDTTGDLKPAFNYFDSPGTLKRFTMVRPILQTEGKIMPAFSLNVDFENSAPTTTPTYSGSSGSPWDTSPWDTSPWALGLQTQTAWQSVAALGRCGTLRMQTASKNFSISLAAIDYIFEPSVGVNI